ncbi:MAG: S-layer protein [Candidatus Diapherotrites archaeon]|nr:S-layer protein [Candidatus Diapherotrites archaeon]
MKNIGVKKLAAIAAGAALLGTAIAPFATAAVSDLTKADFYASSGSPIVNVVVGNSARASDVIWAGNIASKLAEKATTTQTITKTVSGGGTANVSAAKIAVTVGGGATTFANAKTLEDYLISATSPLEPTFDRNIAIDSNGTITGTSLTSSALPDLTDKTTTYKYNGANTSITVKERLSLAANPRFNTASDVERMALDIDAGSFAYILDLGNGIPVHSSATAITAFSDGTDDHMMVPFFGKNYLVKDIDETTAGSELIKLVESNAKKTLLPGESAEVEGKGAYAGKTLTLVMDVLNTAGTSAKFILKDGDTVLQTVTQGTGDLDFTDNAGNDIMDTTVTVDTITATGSNTTTGVTNGYVDMFVGASGLTLYNSKGYPYDSSNSTGIYEWAVTFYFSNGDTAALARTLKEIKIANSNKRWNDASAVKVGESAEFVSGAYKVKFQGWKNDKSLTTIKVGNEKLDFKDSSGSSHAIPLVVKGDASDDTWNAFTFDGKTINYQVDKTDSNIKITEGNEINGRTWTNIGRVGDRSQLTVTGISDYNVPVDGNIWAEGVNYRVTGADANSITVSTSGRVQFLKNSVTRSADSLLYTSDANTAGPGYGYVYYSDGTVWDTNGTAAGTTAFTIEGQNSQTYRYALQVREGDNKIWVLLNDQNISTEFTGNSKTISFLGTDYAQATEDGVVDTNRGPILMNGDVGTAQSFYRPDDSAFGGDSADNTYYTALFQIDTGTVGAAAVADGTADWNAYVSTKYGDGKLITLPNSNLSGYSYQATRLSGANVQALNLRSDTADSYYATAYDDVGSLAAVADGVLTLTIPETKMYVQEVVTSTGTTESIANGDAGTLEVGKTITIGTTKISIADAAAVTGVTVSGADSNAPPETVTVTVPAALNGKATVVWDNGEPGAAILVGGQAVNRLTRALGAVVNAQIQKAGDAIVVKSGDKIVVAGYTAADTGRAAQELINFLETQ